MTACMLVWLNACVKKRERENQGKKSVDEKTRGIVYIVYHIINDDDDQMDCISKTGLNENRVPGRCLRAANLLTMHGINIFMCMCVFMLFSDVYDNKCMNIYTNI